MGMIGMGNECYLYVNGISVSKPIWLHDTVLASVNPDQSQTGDFDQFQPEDYRQSPAALSLGLPPCM